MLVTVKALQGRECSLETVVASPTTASDPPRASTS
uniref:Uncharacterized protein n=1 Tax=Melopsittacus undulatus TaxID=13146 RepID=A0A8V5GMN5_MELUD